MEETCAYCDEDMAGYDIMGLPCCKKHVHESESQAKTMGYA